MELQVRLRKEMAMELLKLEEKLTRNIDKTSTDVLKNMTRRASVMHSKIV